MLVLDLAFDAGDDLISERLPALMADSERKHSDSLLAAGGLAAVPVQLRLLTAKLSITVGASVRHGSAGVKPDTERRRQCRSSRFASSKTCSARNRSAR